MTRHLISSWKNSRSLPRRTRLGVPRKAGTLMREACEPPQTHRGPQSGFLSLGSLRAKQIRMDPTQHSWCNWDLADRSPVPPLQPARAAQSRTRPTSGSGNPAAIWAYRIPESLCLIPWAVRPMVSCRCSSKIRAFGSGFTHVHMSKTGLLDPPGLS